MIFLHGLALAVYEFQRYLKYREDQRQEMLKREQDQQAAMAYVASAMEKAEAATAAADAGYAAWKEAMIFAALEAERVSAYSKNAGTPAALEVHRLEEVALEKAHVYAEQEKKRAAAALAMEKAQAAAAGTDLPCDEDAAAAVAASKAQTVPAKQDKPKKKGIFGGMKTGFML